jgi:hypothetical protein
LLAKPVVCVARCRTAVARVCVSCGYDGALAEANPWRPSAAGFASEAPTTSRFSSLFITSFGLPYCNFVRRFKLFDEPLYFVPHAILGILGLRVGAGIFV